ncbi:MAG TPA: LysR substrate-binding domain-containing protein [Dongiaceae bacterium]|jgi:LysR family glycine cleavage system transcriptional activator
MRKLPPLSYLQAFEAAARLKSFTEAARELNCTQAAISQRIRGLETVFGRALFHRLPSGVQPTEAAEVYLRGIGEALDQLSSITRGLAGIRPAKTVSVSVPVTFASLWLAPRLKTFMKDYPDIDVRLNCTIWNDPNSETSDFQIQLLSSEKRISNGHRLTRDKAFAVCAPELLPKRDGSRPNTYFEDQPLIVLIAKYDYWTFWRNKMGAAQIGNGRRIEVDTGILAIELARHGHGIALALETYTTPYLERGELVKPFPESIDLDLSHFILRPVDHQLSRPAELFQEFLIEESKRNETTAPPVDPSPGQGVIPSKEVKNTLAGARRRAL